MSRHTPAHPRGRAWIEVDASALVSNARVIATAVEGRARLIPMVKADGYGLGAVRAVRALEVLEPWGYGVATASEGVSLRDAGVVRPIFIASPLTKNDVRDALRARLEPSVSSVPQLAEIAAGATALSSVAVIHLEVDTGMGRAGLPWRHADRWVPRVQRLLSSRTLVLGGVFTHLHSADESREAVHEQWNRFRRALHQLDPPTSAIIHVLNSAGALRTPTLAADAVRPGIFLYGGSAGTDLQAPTPVVAVRARIVHLRDAEPGDSVGYGATYRARQAERWATLAIGYGDGLPRSLGNKGHAVIRGVRAPMIGRTSMDVTVVNVSAVKGVALGDVATLIGGDGRASVTLEDVANLAGTIPYEILTGLGARLPRLWFESLNREMPTLPYASPVPPSSRAQRASHLHPQPDPDPPDR